MELNGIKTRRNGHAVLQPDEKISAIEYHFGEIMRALGLDMDDDSLKDTPNRVAKMYVNELFSGLDASNEPEIKLFDNKHNYNSVLVEKDIPFFSCCEHHFVPVQGKVHIAYIPRQKVIGLSKLHRVVHYFARRPQLQEKMTMQIAEYLKKVLDTEDVAVLVDATHHCIAARGIRDRDSSTRSSVYYGKLLGTEKKAELYNLMNL